jgi:hypothetical protein
MLRLKRLKDSLMRFLGFLVLTPGQRKLLDKLERDYQKMLAQKHTGQNSTLPFNRPGEGDH